MIIEIKNTYLKVEINDFGAELQSIKKTNEDHEYLWQGDVGFWGRRAPILFPIVGKLINNQYVYKGKKYTMMQHGFARDKTFSIVMQTDTQVVLKLTYDDETYEIYPFHFELIISYELKGDLLFVGYDVHNLSDEVMPFSIGGHPAFNWSKNEPASFIIDSPALESYVLTEKGISSNKKAIDSVNNTIGVSEGLFKDDALIFENINSCTFSNGSRGVEMDFSGFPYLGLWSKPSGAPFVCIEPWYGVTDFEDHNGDIIEKKGINFVEHQGSFIASYTIKIV